MNLINISKTMKERKYLLLGLSLFFFNIYSVSCHNQKAAAVEQSDSVGEVKTRIVTYWKLSEARNMPMVV